LQSTPDRATDAAAEFRPLTPAVETPAEFTFKAVFAGILFGILFGAANTYLGLRAGLTVSTSIPVSVMTVALFRALRRFTGPQHILEGNMSQTIGSASSSLASGALFTLPALFIWGLDPNLLQMTMLSLIGGVLGTLFMVPLRKLLIVREHGRLPYPEGTACAQVLKASLAGGDEGKPVFVGLGVGAAVKALGAGLSLWPETLRLRIPGLPRGEVATDVSAALTGVGFILGLRVAAVMVGGGLLASLVLIPALAWWGGGRTEPLYPETQALLGDMSAGQIWTRYIRYIGAGAVATGGLLTLIRTMPTMIESFRVGARAMKADLRGGAVAGANAIPRTERDLSLRTIALTAVGAAVLVAAIPHLLWPVTSPVVRVTAALLVLVFAFFFATVSSRIVGLVGVTSNPTSGMTIAALLGTTLIFYLAGWRDDVGKVAALLIGTIVCTAASIAGDTSQDLKTGFLLGATPRKQQIGQLAGVLTSGIFVCGTLLVLDRAYGLGSKELPAPQANLMKLVIEGVLHAELPWTLVGIGAGLAAIAALLRLPVLAFAVGVYLPVSTMVPVFAGGVLRALLARRAGNAARAEAIRDRGTLFASGLVGGEGLVGVGIAAAAFALGHAPEGIGHEWAGPLAPLVGLAAFAFLLYLLARSARGARG